MELPLDLPVMRRPSRPAWRWVKIVKYSGLQRHGYAAQILDDAGQPVRFEPVEQQSIPPEIVSRLSRRGHYVIWPLDG